MSDLVLKIYNGTAAGAYNGNTTNATLKYILQGGMPDYDLTDNSNYEVDTFQATIIDRNYSINVGDIWRVFELTDSTTPLNGGRILKSSRDSARPGVYGDAVIRITGEDWTGILKDRVVAAGTSFANQTGDAIVKSLLNNYFEVTNCDYNIDQSEIAATSNTLTRDVSKLTVYEAIKDIARMSYGANNREFDFYIYESAVGTLKFRFFEKQTLTPKEIIRPADIRPLGFNVRARTDLYFTAVNVDGSTIDINHCPKDDDFWTEQASDAAYQSMWITTNGTAYRSTSAPLLKGSSYMRFQTDGTKTNMTASLDVDDVDAYSSTQTLDNFISGSGFVFKKERNQRIRFSVRLGTGLTTALQSGNKCSSIVFYINYTSPTSGLILGQSSLQLFANPDTMSTSGPPLVSSPQDDKWFTFDAALSDLVPAETQYVRKLHFQLFYTAPNGADNFMVDNLRFYESTGQVAGTYPASPAAPIKEFNYVDSNIRNDSDATAVATSIYTTLRQDYEGTIILTRPRPTLAAGDTVTLSYPEAGIVGVDINVQQSRRQPGVQTLTLGRRRTARELQYLVSTQIKRA